ncbi:hypothetical protein CJ305_11700 [Leeuwenhoekiella nanhaiensis]|uniref:Uncharacterized protein n=1 Tax=Leeuwenhoekiella nanhaiensis TaxID=1655491 RepID=A0A2G1VS28_9FLAO|nr:hypothetical protein CJ305_11700 [Leeuwenhoekiella nanhaiensis]
MLPSKAAANIQPFLNNKETFLKLFFLLFSNSFKERKPLFYQRFWSGKYRTNILSRKHFLKTFFQVFN